LDDFCDVVITADLFTRSSTACVKLICTIFQANGVFTAKLRRLAVSMSENFFKYPTNSFLHNSFVSLLQLIVSKRHLTPELIIQMALSDEIMRHYSRRSELVGCSFWGQLRTISNLINPYISKTDADVSLWKNLVIQRNKVNEAIIATSYGGSLQSAPWKRSKCDVICLVSALFAVVIAMTAVVVPLILK
jgi:hypothetical protein